MTPTLGDAVQIRTAAGNVDPVATAALLDASIESTDQAITDAIADVHRRQDTNLADVLSAFSTGMSSFTAAINEQAAVIAAASRNQTGSSGMAILVGLAPAEIPARGDREVTVGGHMFVPGVPGLYQCKWTTSNGVVIMSEPVAAINSNVVRCTNPRWTHSYSTRDWATTFSLTECVPDCPRGLPFRSPSSHCERVS